MRAQEPLDPYVVNMTHLELFNNLFSKEFQSVEDSAQPDALPITLYIKHALTTPYLMYQLLATSALHLSTTTTNSRHLYREHATGLQIRALSQFNQSNPILEVTPANCVPMFLFSSSVGVHLLCDTLCYERDSLKESIKAFTHCVSVNRGVLAVVDQCWDLLRETELGPRFESSRVLMQQTNTSGTECEALRDLINAADINPSFRLAYQASVQQL